MQRGWASPTGLTADVLTIVLRCPRQRLKQKASLSPVHAPSGAAVGSAGTPGSPGFWDNSARDGQGLGQALAQGYHLPSWVSLCCPVMPDQEEVTRLGGRVGDNHRLWSDHRLWGTLLSHPNLGHLPGQTQP